MITSRPSADSARSSLLHLVNTTLSLPIRTASQTYPKLSLSAVPARLVTLAFSPCISLVSVLRALTASGLRLLHRCLFCIRCFSSSRGSTCLNELLDPGQEKRVVLRRGDAHIPRVSLARICAMRLNHLRSNAAVDALRGVPLGQAQFQRRTDIPGAWKDASNHDVGEAHVQVDHARRLQRREDRPELCMKQSLYTYKKEISAAQLHSYNRQADHGAVQSRALFLGQAHVTHREHHELSARLMLVQQLERLHQVHQLVSRPTRVLCFHSLEEIAFRRKHALAQVGNVRPGFRYPKFLISLTRPA
jgi:hypothetical protein